MIEKVPIPTADGASSPSVSAASLQPAPGVLDAQLGSRAARGASVVLLGQIARIIIQIVSVSVLARLLTPVDYGLVAIVLAVVGVGEIFRDFGLSAAAIQAEHLGRRQRDTLLWLNTGIGAALATMVFLAAPTIAAIFGQQELVAIVRALSLTFLINGMMAQYRADLNRRLKFASLIGVDLFAQIFGVGLAIGAALLGAGYWALVIQQLTQAGLTLIALVAIARWLPGLPRRGTNVGSMLRFGRNLMAAQLVGYLNNNIDTITIGLRFTPGQLGIYNRGFQLLMRPLNQMRAPTTTVALPVLSRIRADYERAGRFVIKGQLALGYTLVASLALAAGAAGPLVHVFLGPEWSAVAPIFAVLAIAGAFETLSYVGSWVYLSRGLTGQLFQYSLVSLAIKIICVVVGSNWGVLGVAVGYAVAPGLSWPISLWWLSRLTVLPIRALWLGAFRIIACASCAGGLAYLTVWALSAESVFIQLACAIAVVPLTYFMLFLVFRRVRADLRIVLEISRKALHR